jgi:hypothetical protein
MLKMNTDNVVETVRADYKPSIVYSQSLTEIINKYQKVCDQLNEIADEVPDSVENVDNLIARERDLFDQHARLLNDAMKMKIHSMEDVKAILQLWRNEVVGDQKVKNLSAGDQIVLSVSKFLEGN